MGIIDTILKLMSNDLDGGQLNKLKTVLETVIRQPKCNLSADEMIEKFKTAKSLVGIKETSLKAYENELKTLVKYTSKPLYELTTKDIKEYLSTYQADHSVSPVTIQNKLRYISSFYDYMCMEEYMDKNPVKAIERVRVDKKIKKPFSDEEMQALRDNFEDKREKALVEFLYSTGSRLNETISLKIKDVDFKGREVIVFGKGHKERRVYLNSTAIEALTEYLAVRRASPNDPLFSSQWKNSDMITARAVQKILKELGERAGVENVHPHRFRRTMATNALRAGMAIEKIKEILGHARLDTTMIYCAINHDDIKASFNTAFG